MINWMIENDPENWDAVVRKAIADYTAKGDARRAQEKIAKST